MAGSEYYDHTSFPATGATGSSSAMRTELDSIETGFGKLVDLSGNGNKLMKVNSGATAHTTSLLSDNGTTVSMTGTLAITGALTATSFNGMTVTTTTGTLTLTNGKTLSVSNTLTFTGTDSSSVAFGAGGTVVYTTTTIPATAGGTGLTTYTLGDTLYSSAANTLAKLAGNTTTTKKFLTQTGDGASSAAPGWNTIVAADLPAMVGDSGAGGTKGAVPAPAAGDAAAGKFLKADGTFAVPSGTATGTVTSVAMTVPSVLSVSGSPITTSGTLAVTLATQSANTVLAGPTSGGAAAPTFRALVAADLTAANPINNAMYWMGVQ